MNLLKTYSNAVFNFMEQNRIKKNTTNILLINTINVICFIGAGLTIYILLVIFFIGG